MCSLHPLDMHVFARLCTDSDEFYLEDVTCRVRLQLLEHPVAALSFLLEVGLCLGQTPKPLASFVKSPELSPRVGFMALVSGLAIGSAVDDSRSRDRLVHFPVGAASSGISATCLWRSNISFSVGEHFLMRVF